MSAFSRSKIISVAKDTYPKGDCKHVQYGTAGFRAKADGLDYIMYRMGLLAVLRSKCTQATVGVMITASHNPVEDNGVKLVEPMGEMLKATWEKFATGLVNAADEDIVKMLEYIAESEKIDFENKAVVVIGRDTRPSSPALQDAVMAGVQAMSGEMRDIGVVSTPILHFVVACSNDHSYGEPTEEGYFQKLSNAFVSLRSGDLNRNNYTSEIMFDGANGVGADKMLRLMPFLKDTIKATVYNKGEGILNHLCGADYVKSNQCSPVGVPPSQVRCASVDGDADRVVYSYTDADGKFHLLDGDKIATLVAGYIKELLRDAGLVLNLGLVQTAYANGASTEYISGKLGVPVVFACTGVKHLHAEALQFDIGVYFEANGHGTVLFSPKAKAEIARAACKENSTAKQLQLLMSLINETVGDALSDMLLVETVLLERGWSAADWDIAYTDLPNKLVKVKVQDRSVVTTRDAERICVTPNGLQSAINEAVQSCSRGRSFVRPSGTEDVVRVYAEAKTQKEVDELAEKVVKAVKQFTA